MGISPAWSAHPNRWRQPVTLPRPPVWEAALERSSSVLPRLAIPSDCAPGGKAQPRISTRGLQSRHPVLKARHAGVEILRSAQDDRVEGAALRTERPGVWEGRLAWGGSPAREAHAHAAGAGAGWRGGSHRAPASRRSTPPRTLARAAGSGRDPRETGHDGRPGGAVVARVTRQRAYSPSPSGTSMLMSGASTSGISTSGTSMVTSGISGACISGTSRLTSTSVGEVSLFMNTK